jgi:hypothetical protein
MGVRAVDLSVATAYRAKIPINTQENHLSAGYTESIQERDNMSLPLYQN